MNLVMSFYSLLFPQKGEGCSDPAGFPGGGSETVQVVITACHRSGDVKETDIDFSLFLRLKSRIEAQVPGEACFLVSTRCLPAVSSQGGRVKELSGVSSKGTNPFLGAPPS